MELDNSLLWSLLNAYWWLWGCYCCSAEGPCIWGPPPPFFFLCGRLNIWHLSLDHCSCAWQILCFCKFLGHVPSCGTFTCFREAFHMLVLVCHSKMKDISCTTVTRLKRVSIQCRLVFVLYCCMKVFFSKSKWQKSEQDLTKNRISACTKISLLNMFPMYWREFQQTPWGFITSVQPMNVIYLDKGFKQWNPKVIPKNPHLKMKCPKGFILVKPSNAIFFNNIQNGNPQRFAKLP